MTVSPYTSWLSKVSESDVVIAPLGSGGVVSVDMGGYVRLWETGLDSPAAVATGMEKYDWDRGRPAHTGNIPV